MSTKTVSSSKTRRKGHPQTNPRSLANLIPYKPGENGHQGGYPLKERLQHSLNYPLKQPGKAATAGEVLVYSTLKGAIAREPTPFREVWDRVEGKVPDKRDVTFNGEGLSDILMKLRGYNPPELPGGEESDQL